MRDRAVHIFDINVGNLGWDQLACALMVSDTLCNPVRLLHIRTPAFH